MLAMKISGASEAALGDGYFRRNRNTGLLITQPA
jgi:hypothetical protein